MARQRTYTEGTTTFMNGNSGYPAPVPYGQPYGDSNIYGQPPPFEMPPEYGQPPIYNQGQPYGVPNGQPPEIIIQ